MVMATGTSNTHVKSLADAVVKDVKEAGLQIVGVEGKLGSDWVLVDLGDVVVHLMTASTRALYNLEDLWSFNKGFSGSSELSSTE
jgi:ribosome-associated protein